MTVNAKNKGSRWERQAAELLNRRFKDTWKRVAMSGALGTILEIPALKADIIGKYNFFDKVFFAEAKVGYGGKEMKVKKEWFDKILGAANENYGLPVVVLKFDGSRSGVRYVIATDFDTWDYIFEHIRDLEEENERLHRKLNRLSSDGASTDSVPIRLG